MPQKEAAPAAVGSPGMLSTLAATRAARFFAVKRISLAGAARFVATAIGPLLLGAANRRGLDFFHKSEIEFPAIDIDSSNRDSHHIAKAKVVPLPRS